MSTCNCKTEIEQALAENFRKNRPEFSDHGVRLEGYGFAIVDNTMVMKPTMPYKATAYAPNKTGGPEKVKSFKGTMVFKFCPFCGTKVDGDRELAS